MTKLKLLLFGIPPKPTKKIEPCGIDRIIMPQCFLDNFKHYDKKVFDKPVTVVK